jgi:AcrR family transcriptional regulator
MTVPETSTRQERAQATRRRLLEVAVGQFAARPYNEVPMSDIAEAAGVAHGLVFHHFGSKRGLYLEVVREISHRLFELAATDPSATPGAQLRDVLHQHFLRMEQNQDLLLGYMRGSIALAADPDAWEVLEAFRVRMVEWMCQIVDLDPESPALRLTLRTTGDAMDQLSVRWLQQGRPHPVGAMVEVMVHQVIGSLGGAHSLDPQLDVSRAIRLLSAR